MASNAEQRRASPSAQPLLHSFVTSDFDIATPEDLPSVDVRPLADDTDSDYDDHLRPPQTFLSRCLMAVRRRRPSLSQVDDFESVRLPTDDKKVRKFRWRKRNGARACAVAAVFVVFFLYVLAASTFHHISPTNTIQWHGAHCQRRPRLHQPSRR